MSRRTRGMLVSLSLSVVALLRFCNSSIENIFTPSSLNLFSSFKQHDVSPRLLARAPLAVQSMVKNTFIQYLEFHVVYHLLEGLFEHVFVADELDDSKKMFSCRRDMGQKDRRAAGLRLLAPQSWWRWRRTGTKDLSALNFLSRVRGSDFGVRRESVASKKELCLIMS